MQRIFPVDKHYIIPQRYGGNMVDSYIKSVVPRAFNCRKIYSPEVKYARGLIDKIQA